MTNSEKTSTKNAKHKANPSKKAKVRKKSTKLKINWRTICFVIFVLAWTALSLTASQFFIGIIMIAFLHNSFSQPLWTCVYYALTYLLAIFLVIYIPPKLFALFKQKSAISPRKSSNNNQVFPEASSQDAPTNNQTTVSSTNPLSTNREELGLQHAPTFIDIGLAPIGYVVYITLSMLFTTIMSIFAWFNASESQDVGFTHILLGSDRIIAMLALVFIAPVAEEIIMRGWLYGKLRSKLSLPIAILLTSVLFGFLHGQWNIGVGVFALSLVLCALREITGTIWSGMLLHILSNGIAFYILYIIGG